MSECLQLSEGSGEEAIHRLRGALLKNRPELVPVDPLRHRRPVVYEEICSIGIPAASSSPPAAVSNTRSASSHPVFRCLPRRSGDGGPRSSTKGRPHTHGGHARLSPNDSEASDLQPDRSGDAKTDP